ncbi:MAG: acyl-CoA dehydrogenase family protein [Dehalococcoidia bacterium]
MSDIDALREAARAIASEQIAPRAAATDRERTFPATNLRALGEAGLLGLLAPESSGGKAAGLRAFSVVLEEIGAACASTAMCTLMHGCGTALIAARAGESQAERWLVPAATGAALATLGFSERATGAHFYAPEISAVRVNGHYVLNGRKHFVTSGSHAALYPLLVNASGGQGLDILVVTPDLPGVRFEGAWEGIGMAGNSSISMVLEDAKVPEENLLGAEGDGQGLVFGVVAPTFLIGLASVNTGIARAALEAIAGHATGRKYPTGQTLAEVPVVQRAIGEMSIKVENARQMVRAAAEAADGGRPEALPLVMQAKITATEAAMAVTAEAMQVGGGHAYSRQIPIERHWRDARAGSVMAPTNDVLKEWLGKIVTGQPLF